MTQEAIQKWFGKKIYLTRVHQSPDGDAFFPELARTGTKAILNPMMVLVFLL